MKPAASLVKLLRLVEADPTALKRLGSKQMKSGIASRQSPFEAAGGDIATMNERTFPELLRKLLYAEAEAYDLPTPEIHVASNIHAADGGEDGRISWTGGPSGTRFLASRLNQFQLKAGKISPSKAASEVLSGDQKVKPMVDRVLRDGGNYVLLCAHSYSFQQIEDRKSRILDALRNTGLLVEDNQVDFRDADQIADWVNHHPAVAVWVLERTQPGLLGPFRSWLHWANRAEHAGSPLVKDERLPELWARMQKCAGQPQRTLRVVGLSGIGKSRLVLEALRDKEDGEGSRVSDIVMYTSMSEASAERINCVVQNLADSGLRTVVVVDDCELKTHQILAGMVLRQGSRLSLITIDNETLLGSQGADTVEVNEAPETVTAGIIKRILPGLGIENRSRLERFSKGYPLMALRIGEAWKRGAAIAGVADWGMTKTFVLGRHSEEPELLLKVARLLATFGMVGIEGEVEGQFQEVSRLGRDINSKDMYVAIHRLVERGIVQRRGRHVIIQPRPIAMKLTEMQWQEWTIDKWEWVLAGDVDTSLKIQAAKQLALINTTDIAKKVVSRVCRHKGPFNGPKGLYEAGHAEVLSSLAEVDSMMVAESIGGCLDEIDDLTKVEGNLRRHLVWAAEKIAFVPDSFEEGADLLLRLALAENESYANNATGQFIGLFPMFAGNTAADGTTRLLYLDGVIETGDAGRLRMAAMALGAASATYRFTRVLGPESHGLREALKPWHPTVGEAREYLISCVIRLSEIANREDEAGALARKDLGFNLRSLVSREGLIDLVEQVVSTVTDTVGYWPVALASMSLSFARDAEQLDSETTERVRAVYEKLKPRSLEDRLQADVTDYLIDFHMKNEQDYQKLYEDRVETARNLAAEMIREPDTLSRYLSQLSIGSQSMAREFGREIADVSETPLDWLKPVVEAVIKVPRDERNYDLMAGFVAGLNEWHPDEVVAFKKWVGQSRELASSYPLVCAVIGITPSDIHLAIQALQDELLNPIDLREWQNWLGGSTLSSADVTPLFNVLLDHSAEGYREGIDLIWWYATGTSRKLEGLKPVIIKLAENASCWQQPTWWGGDSSEFGSIIDWMLRKGRGDRSACATALSLAKAVVVSEGESFFSSGVFIRPVMPRLLSDFPEIVWPIIGEAIISDKLFAETFRFTLGDAFSFSDQPNKLLLNLPEHTLFAWCHAHPNSAPAFTASVVPILTTQGADASEREFHPIMIKLIDEFGEMKNVQRAVESNIFTFSWTGSKTTYFAIYKDAFGKLAEHPKASVRRWVKDVVRQMDSHIRNASNEYEEYFAQSEL